MRSNTVKIFVQLLADEKGTLRPTKAVPLENGLYRVLPITNYDKVGETWEFPPGSVVHCEKRSDEKEDYLLAVAKA